jgi:hypothetical protein
MEKTRKTYITSRKEIDRIVELAFQKPVAHLSGIKFPNGYSFPLSLTKVMFTDCDLRYADLDNLWALNGSLNCLRCDLRGQDLSGFEGFDLVSCDMRKCSLRHATLLFGNKKLGKFDTFRDNDLRGADMTDMIVHGLRKGSATYRQFYDAIPMACPRKGKYTAYKKLDGGFLAELEIPARAKRLSSSDKGKCRASEAFVKRIYLKKADGSGTIELKEGYSIRGGLHYRVGETVRPDRFETDRFVTCAPGIHHFMTEQEAIDYEA